MVSVVSLASSLSLQLLCFLAVTTMMRTTSVSTVVTAQYLSYYSHAQAEAQTPAVPDPSPSPSQSQSQSQLQASLFECGGDFNPTVAGIICAPNFDFVYGTLCAALQAPSHHYLFDTLNDPAATVTLWAPDNRAFENLNDVLVALTTTDTDTDTPIEDFLFRPAGESMLTNLLLHHVADEWISSNELTCNGQVTTLFGTSTTQCDSAVTGPIFQVGLGNTNKEFRPKYENKYGIEACNGIIYSMDNVILPYQFAAQASPNSEVVVEEEAESSTFTSTSNATATATATANATVTVTIALPAAPSVIMNNNDSDTGNGTDNDNEISSTSNTENMLAPTNAPTNAPTYTPTDTPTNALTNAPTNVPTDNPTIAPTNVPTDAPTDTPTTNAPTTDAPTDSLTNAPTAGPTVGPTTAVPTATPTLAPTTLSPTTNPTINPTTAAPTVAPSESPSGSFFPSSTPTVSPTTSPIPSANPTAVPSASPTNAPTDAPTDAPTTAAPTTNAPTNSPTTTPTTIPTATPTTTTTTLTPSSIENSSKSRNTCGQMDAPESILDYICSMDHFNILCNAIQRVGLDTVVGGMTTSTTTTDNSDTNDNGDDDDDDDSLITLFAPTDAGMEDAGLTLVTIEVMDATKLLQILQNHILLGTYRTDELLCDATYHTLSSSPPPPPSSSLSSSASVEIQCLQLDGSETKTVNGPYNNYMNRPILVDDQVLCNGIVQPIDNAIRNHYYLYIIQ